MLNILNYIFSSYIFSVVLRVVVGTILCGIIGLERQSLNKPAGFKTHAILGLSGVLIMLLSEHMERTAPMGMYDATRIPAQLLSGIGFIGAGTILRDGFNVKGLTTAASLLAVTCIGLSVGAKFYLGAVLGTVVIYMLLSHSNNLINKMIFSKDASYEDIENNESAVIENDVKEHE